MRRNNEGQYQKRERKSVSCLMLCQLVKYKYGSNEYRVRVKQKSRVSVLFGRVGRKRNSRWWCSCTDDGMGNESDLLVVGPGVLGKRIAEQWKLTMSTNVVGKTRSDATRKELLSLPSCPFEKVVTSWQELDSKVFKYVIFCAPPSGNDDYPAEVTKSTKYYDKNFGGNFVFTSSAGVYAVKEGICFENSELEDITTGSARIKRLFAAEKAATDAGGCVIRLSGLYHRDRGAHTYYLKGMRDGGTVEASKQTLLNLIHYDDAASIAIAALWKGRNGEVYVGTDMNPITREDMMNVTLKSSLYGSDESDASNLSRFFCGPNIGIPVGKMLDNTWTRNSLDWQPQYTSFKSFMASQCSSPIKSSPRAT